MKDYYTAARVACNKVRIWQSEKEDAVQFIVMHLWENNLPEDIDFKTLVTYSCNKAKDYLRFVNGYTGNKSRLNETVLLQDHLKLLTYNPEDAIHKKLDYEKIPAQPKYILDSYLKDSKEYKEIGKDIGVSEGRVSQILKAFIDREYLVYDKIRRKIK